MHLLFHGRRGGEWAKSTEEIQQNMSKECVHGGAHLHLRAAHCGGGVPGLPNHH